jgi:hypothetical protein
MPSNKALTKYAKIHKDLTAQVAILDTEKNPDENKIKNLYKQINYFRKMLDNATGK